MKKADKERLEAKYTGNQRRLTDGEAANILHDPANETENELEEDEQAFVGPGPLDYPNAVNRLQR